MTGSAFITHNGTFSCSNEVVLDLHSTPIIQDGKVAYIKEEKTLTIYGIFNADQPLKLGDKCEFVILNDELGKTAWSAEVRSIGEFHIILNIFSQNNRIKEILSNITFKK